MFYSKVLTESDWISSQIVQLFVSKTAETRHVASETLRKILSFFKAYNYSTLNAF